VVTVCTDGLHQVDHKVRAHPGQMSADLWKPGVVAHRESDAADVGDGDGNEAVSGGGPLVGAPGEDLAVEASEPAVGGEDQCGVEDLAEAGSLVDGSGISQASRLRALTPSWLITSPSRGCAAAWSS
jgi:hypothetical protein